MKKDEKNPYGKLTKKDLLAALESLRGALQRERADAANIRRRLHQDGQQRAEAARLATLSGLLPLLDNLQRAFGAVPAHLQQDGWVQGVLRIDQQLAGYLKDLELKPITAVGREFDPALMEAVAVVADADRAEGLVVEEVLRGYFYKDQVLRPAQVKVVQNGG